MFELLDPSQPLFWVLVAFLVFVALLLWNGVPGIVGKMLDERAEGIRKELDQARKLREEAQALLADYQRKSREAETEAKIIIDQAKREAEALATGSRKTLTEMIDRRSKLAEDKIARAEAQAVSEVRATAVETALAAAENILKAKVPGSTADSLIDQSIRDLKGKLN